jgi:hypothetical protein
MHYLEPAGRTILRKINRKLMQKADAGQSNPMLLTRPINTGISRPQAAQIGPLVC